MAFDSRSSVCFVAGFVTAFVTVFLIPFLDGAFEVGIPLRTFTPIGKQFENLTANASTTDEDNVQNEIVKLQNRLNSLQQKHDSLCDQNADLKDKLSTCQDKAPQHNVKKAPVILATGQSGHRQQCDTESLSNGAGVSFVKWRELQLQRHGPKNETSQLKMTSLPVQIETLLRTNGTFQNHIQGVPKTYAEQYNITSHMVRRSRTVIGNTDRIHRVIERILAGECIRVVVLGGSVSYGYNIGGPELSYVRVFEQWLNAEYPCQIPISPGMPVEHEVVRKAIGGTSTSYAIEYWYTNLIGLDPIDFIIVEFAVNDGFVKTDTKRRISDSLIFSQQWNTETLIRKCLRLRTKDGKRAAALVYLEAGFKGRNFLKSMNRTHDQNGMAEDVAAWSHWPVLQYYQIPTVSFTDVMLPLMLPMRECHDPVNPTWGCYPKNEFWQNEEFGFFHVHRDVCCHPAKPSHNFMAMLLMYFLETEKQVLNSADVPLHSDKNWRFERDLSMYGDGSVEHTKLPALLKLTPQEELDNVINDKPDLALDFSNAYNPPDSSAFMSEHKRWTVFADSKDKIGLISHTSFSHVSIPLRMSKRNTTEIKVSIGSLQTYSNISAVAVWLSRSNALEPSQSKNGSPTDGLCSEEFASSMYRIDGCGNKAVSIYQNIVLPVVSVVGNDCSEWQCTCQGFSNKFGISRDNVFKKEGLNLDWFQLMGCTTKPSASKNLQIDSLPDYFYLHFCLLPGNFSQIQERVDKSEPGMHNLPSKFKILGVFLRSNG